MNEMMLLGFYVIVILGILLSFGAFGVYVWLSEYKEKIRGYNNFLYTKEQIDEGTYYILGGSHQSRILIEKAFRQAKYNPKKAYKIYKGMIR